ncbi:MAG: hypothetical protein EA409_08500 [Saprospirales bacterium]|nr:MAG: hypothetical protein EA409_08500 [Saprospirales bacterium]
MKREIDICIISEVHLGTIGCNPLELLKYLKSIKPSFLIVNGNFIDKSQFRKKYFSRKHLLVIHQIMQMALEGTRVVIITGKEETLLKKYAGVNLGNIHLRREMILKLQGREYLIIDNPIAVRKGLLHKMLNSLSKRSGNLLKSIGQLASILPGTSENTKNSNLFKYLKAGPPSLEKVAAFEAFSADFALKRGFSAIICGKIRQPAIKKLKVSGETISYLNAGDWIHSLSSLEFSNGKWEIYTYNDLDFGLPNPRLKITEEKTEKPEDIFIIRKPLSTDS